MTTSRATAPSSPIGRWNGLPPVFFMGHLSNIDRCSLPGTQHSRSPTLNSEESDWFCFGGFLFNGRLPTLYDILEDGQRDVKTAVLLIGFPSKPQSAIHVGRLSMQMFASMFPSHFNTCPLFASLRSPYLGKFITAGVVRSIQEDN